MTRFHITLTLLLIRVQNAFDFFDNKCIKLSSVSVVRLIAFLLGYREVWGFLLGVRFELFLGLILPEAARSETVLGTAV